MGDALQTALKLDRLARDLDGAAKRRILLAGGASAKKAILRIASGDMGGDLSLSKWRGSVVRVGYDVAGDSCIVTGRDSKGGAVWHVLEKGAGTHRITRKGGRGRKKKRTSLRIKGGFPGRSVLHPGTRGKRTWTQGVAAASPDVKRAMGEELARTVASYFGG